MTRTIILIVLLYALPVAAQKSLILENITLDSQDRNFFAKDIISAPSSSKPVVIKGTSKVDFQAVNRISMGPGFSTSDLAGDARFHAYIQENPNAVEELYDRSANLNIAPNPNDGYFTLSVEDEQIIQICVMDVLGRSVYERQNISSDREELQLENLPKGMYFVRVITNKDLYVSKMEMK